ncbi:MAG: hypothetical protein GY862_10570 [Gammaproteobacteria bacterium]|nr:hypothetical protein [Gammaproteobacteria bacterium]
MHKTSFPAALILLLTTVLPAYAVPAAGADRPAVKAKLATRSLLLDVAGVGAKVVAAGERGHILVSADNGKTWNQSDVPTQAALTAVFFHDENLGWAAGHDAIILHSDDGGAHWRHQYSAPEKESPLLDIWFRDARHGFAIGAYGLFLVTRDGGGSWLEQSLSEDFHLNGMAAGKKSLFIAGEAGALYRSDDAGRRWNPLGSPYEGSFFGILSLPQNHLLIFGLRGNVFRSADRGRNWTRIATHTKASFLGGTVLGDGTVIVAGMAGSLLISRDNGRTFSAWQRPDGKAISSVVETADGFLILTGEFGVHRLDPASIPSFKASAHELYKPQ